MYQFIEQKILNQIKKNQTHQSKNFFSKLLWDKLIWERDLFLDTINSIPFAILFLNQKNKIILRNRYAKKYFKLETKWSKNSLMNIFKLARYQEIKIALDSLFEEKNSIDHVELTIFDQKLRDLVIKLFSFQLRSFEMPAWLKSGKVKLIVILDISNWKNQSLRINQEKSINSLHTLTAGIAHEIKNPLGALDLHLQLIKRFIKNNMIENKGELEELTQIVSEEISRLESIANDFLFSFRPIKPSKKPISLNQIIKETALFLEPKLKEKKIKLDLDLDPTISLFLFDKDQIKQVIINLIGNSIEAILERDQIKQGHIKIQTKELKQKIIMIISDNGTGISQKKFSEIFQPFYTSKKMGTGLGLSIVTKIIQDHEGEIILNQDVKEGAEFIIEFLRIKIKSNLLTNQ